MPEVNFLAVLGGAVALFVIGAGYYAALGKQLAQVSGATAEAGQMPPWKIAVEFLRCLVIAAVVAGLAAQADVDEWTGGSPPRPGLVDRIPVGALGRGRGPRADTGEACRDPRGRLAGKAARGCNDRERVAVGERVLGSPSGASSRHGWAPPGALPGSERHARSGPGPAAAGVAARASGATRRLPAVRRTGGSATARTCGPPPKGCRWR